MNTTDLWLSKSAIGANFSPRIPRGMRPSRFKSASEFTIYFNPRIPRGMRQQKQINTFLFSHSYYSIFYRILQGSGSYKTKKVKKGKKNRCEVPGGFMFASGSHHLIIDKDQMPPGTVLAVKQTYASPEPMETNGADTVHAARMVWRSIMPNRLFACFTLSRLSEKTAGT